jgi:hypothetical protein
MGLLKEKPPNLESTVGDTPSLTKSMVETITEEVPDPSDIDSHPLTAVSQEPWSKRSPMEVANMLKSLPAAPRGPGELLKPPIIPQTNEELHIEQPPPYSEVPVSTLNDSKPAQILSLEAQHEKSSGYEIRQKPKDRSDQILPIEAAPEPEDKKDKSNEKNLWKLAMSNLSQDELKHLDFECSETLETITQVLEATTKKKEECLAKRWKYTNLKGEKVVIRDVLDKVMAWVDKFKMIGDVVVQYDPVHAALPWAGVRFFLQVRKLEIPSFPLY